MAIKSCTSWRYRFRLLILYNPLILILLFTSLNIGQVDSFLAVFTRKAHPLVDTINLLRGKPDYQKQEPQSQKYKGLALVSPLYNHPKVCIVTPEKIQHLRESVDILSLIRSYNLPNFNQTQKSQAIATCPFHTHNENNENESPSLIIDDKEGTYKCTTCGASGDAVHFVIEYGKITGQQTTFLQAAEHVHDHFCQDGALSLQSLPTDYVVEGKQRIWLANAVAAAFYTNCLASTHCGGAGRSYLLSQKIKSRTVREFELGYAPDFRNHETSYTKAGFGTLTEHLQNSGFTVQEILETGLAIPRKRKGNNDNDELGFDSIMDRFQHQIIFPVFDAKKENILGFGALHLDESRINNDDKVEINDNNIVAGQGKNDLIFGNYPPKDDNYGEVTQKQTPLILVTGYTNVLALWQAGIEGVFTCTNSLLWSVSQLEAIAKVSRMHGGELIMCHSNDEEEINHLEELCLHGTLSEVSEKYAIDIMVTNLPSNTILHHDYGLLSEQQTKKLKAEIKRQNEPWSEWYLKQIFSRYNKQSSKGNVASHADLFEQLVGFICSLQKLSDRTKLTEMAASSLASIIAGSTGKSKSSNSNSVAPEPLRIQLQSDLTDRVKKYKKYEIPIAEKLQSTETDNNLKLDNENGNDTQQAPASEMMMNHERNNNVTIEKIVSAAANSTKGDSNNSSIMLNQTPLDEAINKEANILSSPENKPGDVQKQNLSNKTITMNNGSKNRITQPQDSVKSSLTNTMDRPNTPTERRISVSHSEPKQRNPMTMQSPKIVPNRNTNSEDRAQNSPNTILNDNSRQTISTQQKMNVPPQTGRIAKGSNNDERQQRSSPELTGSSNSKIGNQPIRSQNSPRPEAAFVRQASNKNVGSLPHGSNPNQFAQNSPKSRPPPPQQRNNNMLRMPAKRKEQPPQRPKQKRTYIAPQQLESLQNHVDIVDVIESYNLPKFNRRGDRASAICPFHDDSSPSLQINSAKGIYKCFACGAGGNAISFVRQYNGINGQQVSFLGAVKHLYDNFYNGPPMDFENIDITANIKDKQEMSPAAKNMIQMNAAAAAFFATSLAAPRLGGKARSHLMSRGISPTTVRSFAIGYAPDVYFQSDKPKGQQQTWGSGSLVHYLRDLGFTAEEILHGGLAIAINRGRQRQKEQQNSDAKTDDGRDKLDFDSIMDRFRGRLIIPIFDVTGQNILGFGGRIVEENNPIEEGYQQPKYLNSPETAAFHKKNILFGQNLARQKEKDVTSWPLVMVEGYMDAIALHQAGIYGAVASMGTAVSIEQLYAAASTAKSRGGAFMLCLDNDDAGIAAVERLCIDGLLMQVTEKTGVQIRVAILPPDVKDPDDFVTSRKSIKDKNITDLFYEEVIEKSIEWSEWHISRILNSYNSTAQTGQPGSVGKVFDNVASFISTFKNPADRTRRTSEAARTLATLMVSTETNMAEPSDKVCQQLEADLLDKVSLLANSKKREDSRRQMPATGSSTTTGMRNPLHHNRAGKLQIHRDRAAQPMTKRPAMGSGNPNYRNYPQRQNEKMVPMNRQQRAPPLTPHFTGLDFEHKSDRDWVNSVKSEERRRTGKKEIPERLVFFNSNEYHGHQYITQEAIDSGYKGVEDGKVPQIDERGVGALVEINADAQALAAENSLLRVLALYRSARNAMRNAIDTSHVAGSQDKIEWSSEEREWLFDALIEKYHELPANIVGPEHILELRKVLSEAPSAPVGAFRPEEADIAVVVADPTNNEKTNNKNSNESQQQTANVIDVDVDVDVDAVSVDRVDVSTRGSMVLSAVHVHGEDDYDSTSVPSTPVQAKKKPQKQGSLDEFFKTESDLFTTTYSEYTTPDERAALSVLELYSTLLRTTARKRVVRVQSELQHASQLLSIEMEKNINIASQGDNNEGQSENQEIDQSVRQQKLLEIQLHYKSLVAELQDAISRERKLAESAKRLGGWLLQSVMSEGGSMSQARWKKLAHDVDSYLEEIKDHPNLEKNKEATSDEFGNFDDYDDDEDDESFEEIMERLDSDWGEFCNDDYVWTPDAVETNLPVSLGMDPQEMEHLYGGGNGIDDNDDDPDDNESLEEFLARIDSEWAEWEDDERLSLNRGQAQRDATLEEAERSMNNMIDNKDNESNNTV